MATIAAADPAETTPRILLEAKSVQSGAEQPFTSGRGSPVYFDYRCLIAFPRARRHLTDLAAARVKPFLNDSDGCHSARGGARGSASAT